MPVARPPALPLEKALALDLGARHYVTFLRLEGVEHPAGLILWHRPPLLSNCAEGCEWMDGWCASSIAFRTVAGLAMAPRGPHWRVEAWDPLTLSPSLACSCGDHGFIRSGRWVAA